MSTATIGQKNWQAIKLSGNGEVVAVASRNLDKCNEFIKQLQNAVPFEVQPRAIEGYGQLLAADDIDAVYIPLPTGLRKKWVIKAAESGKHVMCEKPCAGSASELAAMIDACEKNGVQNRNSV
jgi:predicted dehydrogenase